MDEIVDRLNVVEVDIATRPTFEYIDGRIRDVRNMAFDAQVTSEEFRYDISELFRRVQSLEHALAAKPWLEAEVDLVPYINKEGMIERITMRCREPGEMPLETVISPELEQFLKGLARDNEEAS